MTYWHKRMSFIFWKLIERISFSKTLEEYIIHFNTFCYERQFSLIVSRGIGNVHDVQCYKVISFIFVQSAAFVLAFVARKGHEWSTQGEDNLMKLPDKGFRFHRQQIQTAVLSRLVTTCFTSYSSQMLGM